VPLPHEENENSLDGPFERPVKKEEEEEEEKESK
jgi:hypothetical protein